MPQREHHALVLGGGTMGVGIIAMFLGGGWTVDVVSRSASTREGLPAALAKALAGMGKPTDTSGLRTFATLPEADTSNLAVGDLNGDGNLDVVATNPQKASMSSRVVTARSPAITSTCPTASRCVAARRKAVIMSSM